MKDDCREWITQLVEQFGELVFATVYRVLGNPDDAEDAFQDVFLKIVDFWNRRSNPETVSDWGAYLRVVATRAAIDLRRRRIQRNRSRIALTTPKGRGSASGDDRLDQTRRNGICLAIL